MASQDLNLNHTENNQLSSLIEKPRENREIQRERPALERAENGFFAPGNPGGPGRPRNIESPTAAYKQILAERGATELAQVVYNDALTAKNARDRLAAASEITDRVDGKATQRVDMRGIVVMMPAEASLGALDDWAGDE